MQFAHEFIASERCQLRDVLIAAAIRNFLQEWMVSSDLWAGCWVCLNLLCVGGDVNVPKSIPQLLGSGRSLFISSVSIHVFWLLLNCLANMSNTSSNFHALCQSFCILQILSMTF